MAERKIRKGKEEGHRRKFMVVVDESLECESAVYFSACRARNTGSDLHMLFVVESEVFQYWLSVEAIHQQEGERKAVAVFRLYQWKLNNWGFDDVNLHESVQHGTKPEAILQTIEDDGDISFLVLGASTSAEGPETLVSTLAGKQAGTFPVPIMIIPGSLELHEIDALA